MTEKPESMVERMAEAVTAWLEAKSREDGDYFSRTTHGEVQFDGWFDPKALARAALEALKEPTEDICEVLDGLAYDGENNWRNYHEAMINAALSEEE